MSTGAYPGPRPDRASAQQARAAALSRLSRVRGLTIVAAGALTAAVAGVVSAASGRTLGHHAVRTATVAPRTSATATLPPLASPRQLGLRGPGRVPRPQSQAPAPPSQAAPQPVAPQPVAPQTVQPPAAPGPAVSGGS